MSCGSVLNHLVNRGWLPVPPDNDQIKYVPVMDATPRAHGDETVSKSVKEEADAAAKTPPTVGSKAIATVASNPVKDDPVNDPVNHPSHYCDGGIETIDYIRAKLTPEEYRGYLRGTALKYLSRAGKKDGEDASKDFKKALVYVGWLEQSGVVKRAEAPSIPRMSKDTLEKLSEIIRRESSVSRMPARDTGTDYGFNP